MKIKNTSVEEFLTGAGQGACSSGKEWARSNCSTMRDVWEKCEKGGWMLWVLKQLGIYDASVSRFLVVMLKTQPIQEGKVFFDLLTDERSRNVVIVLEKFLDGGATLDELLVARDASSDAYAAAYAASDAAYAASDAAYFVSAAYAAYDASDAAYAAAAAAAPHAAAAQWQADKLREIVIIEWE